MTIAQRTENLVLELRAGVLILLLEAAGHDKRGEPAKAETLRNRARKWADMVDDFHVIHR